MLKEGEKGNPKKRQKTFCVIGEWTIDPGPPITTGKDRGRKKGWDWGDGEVLKTEREVLIKCGEWDNRDLGPREKETREGLKKKERKNANLPGKRFGPKSQKSGKVKLSR